MYNRKKKQSNLEEIYAELAKIEDIENSHNLVIKVYKKNELFLKNVKTFISISDLKLFKEISFLYANALFSKDRYNDTIDSINFSLPIINSGIETKKAKQLKDGLLEKMQLLQGISHYKLKDYKNSTPIFKDLTKVDSKNENYKMWLNHSKYGEKAWIAEWISMISLCLVVIGYLIGDLHEDSIFKSILILLGGPLLIATSIYQFFSKRKLKKLKK